MTDMDKYRVTLTAQERADLEQLVSCGKAAARKLTHARILLPADDSLGNERADDEIVAALGTSLRTVSRVRHQLVTEGLDVALLRRRQPPRPDKIKIRGDIEQRLVELACSDPPRAAATGPCNCPRTSWSSSAWSTGSAPRRYARR